MTEWQHLELDGNQISYKPFNVCPERSAVHINGVPWGVVDTNKVEIEVRAFLDNLHIILN